MLPDDMCRPLRRGPGHRIRIAAGSISSTRSERAAVRQLVIVHYGPHHSVHDEYVENAADIDAAPVVWARDMGLEKNTELLRYYPSRKVWWLDVDRKAELSPYDSVARP